ncbi:MAG: hypothetical protein CVU59_04615 [Deltaproteobacteria bacterium HGW-Deltaproteobacteria-17]|nr:MAG: hypothetical protein CVU59_04615 [Deltaproteobacteria bacterium HGW-Deltaproteobacteria-17]
MHRFPTFVEWELTDRCDLACVHCHRAGGRRIAEPGVALRGRIADRLVAAGVTSVALSGGEPTLCEDLWSIVARLSGAGVLVTLITNGRDHTEAFPERCRESGLDLVWLSLDGPEEIHDVIRRRAGAFARVLRTAGNLARGGVRFGFMTTLLSANESHLEAVSRIVTDAGAELWQLGWGVPNAGSPELFLPGDRLGRLRGPLSRLAAGNDRLRLGEGLAMALDLEGGMARPGCPSGREVVVVAPDGRLRGCSCLPDDAAGPSLLGDDSLAELSRILRARALRRERELAPAAMTSCGPVASGFCHARVLRDADGRHMASAAPASHAVVESGAGRAALASALLAGWLSWGCSKPGPEEKTTPPEAGVPATMGPAEGAPPVDPPVDPPVEPAAKGADPSATSDATPAGTGPDRSTTNIVAPSSTKPGMKPEPWTMPRCCMMHILVPDCNCSPPPGTIPVP